jgi:hypothetical protein
LWLQLLAVVIGDANGIEYATDLSAIPLSQPKLKPEIAFPTFVYSEIENE